MSGPALRQWDSHSSIHEAALGEAAELTELLRRCVERGETERAVEVAYIAVEHWETRTLQHAQAEEEGLYREIAEKAQDVKETIVALTRDHTLMRHLVRDIKEILGRKGSVESVLQRFQALILVDLLHNEDEGKLVSSRAGRVSHEFSA